MKRIIQSLMIVVLTAGLSGQGTTKVGTSTGQFLKIGVGARAAGMAESFSAVASDISAIYWNPAGLVNIQKNQLYFSHIDWLAGIGYDFMAIAIPLPNNNTIGLFVNSVQVPEDEVRTVLQPEGTGEFFEASDLAIGFSYTRGITDKFAVGFVGKYIQETIWSMTSISVALDVGALYISNWRNLRIGLVLNNFGLKPKLSGRANLLYVDPDPTIEGNIETIRAELEMERWDLPLNLKTSVALNLLSTSSLDLMVALDMIHPNDNREYFNFGSELTVANLLYLRGGYRGLAQDQLEGGAAYGAGLSFSLNKSFNLTVDYAVTDFGRLHNVKQLSVGLGF